MSMRQECERVEWNWCAGFFGCVADGRRLTQPVKNRVFCEAAGRKGQLLCKESTELLAVWHADIQHHWRNWGASPAVMPHWHIIDATRGSCQKESLWNEVDIDWRSVRRSTRVALYRFHTEWLRMDEQMTQVHISCQLCVSLIGPFLLRFVYPAALTELKFLFCMHALSNWYFSLIFSRLHAPLSPHLSPESKNVIASIVACRAAEDRLFLWRSAQFVWRHFSCFHGLGAPLLATGHAQHFRTPFFRTQLFCRHTSLPRTTFSRTLNRHTYISFTHTHTHSHLFLMTTHFSHTTLPPTALKNAKLFPSSHASLSHAALSHTTFLHAPSSTLAHNSFIHDSFTRNTFTYNSLQQSIFHHFLCLSCLPGTASNTVFDY